MHAYLKRDAISERVDRKKVLKKHLNNKNRHNINHICTVKEFNNRLHFKVGRHII